MSETMPEGMPKNVCRKEFQIECRNMCQAEIREAECQTYYQNLSQMKNSWRGSLGRKYFLMLVILEKSQERFPSATHKIHQGHQGHQGHEA